MSEALVAALAPLVIAGLKQVARYIEKELPNALLPALAPIAAVLVDYLLALSGWGSVGTSDAAMLGLAGVGVREVAVKAARAALNR